MHKEMMLILESWSSLFQRHHLRDEKKMKRFWSFNLFVVRDDNLKIFQLPQAEVTDLAS